MPQKCSQLLNEEERICFALLYDCTYGLDVNLFQLNRFAKSLQTIPESPNQQRSSGLYVDDFYANNTIRKKSIPFILSKYPYMNEVTKKYSTIDSFLNGIEGVINIRNQLQVSSLHSTEACTFP